VWCGVVLCGMLCGVAFFSMVWFSGRKNPATAPAPAPATATATATVLRCCHITIIRFQGGLFVSVTK